MDVAVKTAYDRLLSACDRVDALQGTKKDVHLRQILAGDIHSFICSISKAGEEERYDYFNKVYQNDEYVTSALTTASTDILPATFQILLEFDKNYKKSGNVRTAGLFTSFIVTLGKYYLLSRFDKKDIVAEKYLAYVGMLQKCGSTNEPKSKEMNSFSDSAKGIVAQDAQKGVNANESTELQTEPEPEETLDELLGNLIR